MTSTDDYIKARDLVLNRIVYTLQYYSGVPTSYTAGVVYRNIQELANKMTDPINATRIADTIVRGLEDNMPQNESGQTTYYTDAEICKHCRELLPADWQIQDWQIQSPYQSPYSLFQGTT